MKFLKNLISFSIPMLIALITFTLYSTVTNVVTNYKKMIVDDYAIMIVASTPLIKDNITTLATIKVQNIETLRREEIISNIKNQLSQTSVQLLKQKLPFFYKIYLANYPTITQLATIKQELQQISNIKRIETFSSDHSKIYSLLVLSEKTISILFVFLSIFAILILTKQISIWFFEHNKRITIIEYHGGTILYSAMPIIKIAILSSILSSIVTIIFAINIKNNLGVILSPEILNIISSINTININYFQIIFLSLGISLISILGVLAKHNLTKIGR